ncbi:alpha/beta hydrolase [Aquabacterium sp. NJ1]|uniref:alpha/beta hydrolase n=1 Tax=Aquabacterium sp. NJ1 TaxID=1538295 RepID=UPI00068EB650|nr:alpha/beta hydrolase [Aquabacterium sp. NJ1]
MNGKQYMSMLNETILTRDGLKLMRRHWRVARPRGTVVLVHGIAEHSGRYHHVAAQLNEWGWSVESYDQRGHGQSAGPRGRLQRDDDLVRDLAAVVAQVRAEQPCGPLLLMGHSMGGLIVGCYAADLLEPRSPDAPTDVDAVIMISPALAVPMNWFRRLLMATMGRLTPDLCARTGFNPKAICRDEAVVNAYRGDPLVHDRISPRLARFILEGGGYVRALADQWDKPTALLYAGADDIVDPLGARQFADAAPALVHTRCFPHMAHEILNEPDQVMVFHALHAWLEARFARSPTRAGDRLNAA